MALDLPEGVLVDGVIHPGFEKVLTNEAVAFLADLQRRFNPRREELLAARADRQKRLDAGEKPDFLAETAGIRDSEWTVAPLPQDILDRRVEITGPVDRKMIINALNCGANVFMADFEDASTPTWTNMVEGQFNLASAVHREIVFDRNLRRHAAHGMHFAPMAGFYQELAIAAQEMRGHADLGAVRQHRPLLFAELLDEAEDVVPAPAVESGRVLAKLV